MNTLYDLVKRIDALTANSQQVLNALIRSCIATGSSSGYKVKKFDRTISLSRADIYRLYDFYNSWEQAEFPSDDKFDLLLEKADARWRRGTGETSTLATDAVVKHSKILYMTASDKDNIDPNYWTDKIKESASGKAVVSTAPIPINLRTPLYDENLSVKSFSQYETYLFPLGYRRTEILGSPDNGEDYIAGGKNWEFDVSDFFRLRANHITLGNITNATPKLENYGNSSWTFSWGDESYAFGTCSAAMGNGMHATGDYSAAIGGNRSFSYGPSSFATGTYTGAIGSSAVSMNSSTVAGGGSSLAANVGTVTGGVPYEFSVKTVDAVSVTPGSVVCVGEGVSTTIGECYLTADAQTENANYSVLTVKVPASNAIIPFDLKKDDSVQIWGIYGRKDGKKLFAYDKDGYAYSVFITKVADVSLVSGPNSSGTVTYEVRIEDNIPVNHLMNIDGGWIQATSRRVPVYGPAMEHIYDSPINLGYGSTALNRNTVAHGMYQTVVGTSNLINDDARFIVGTGNADLTKSGNDLQTGMPYATRANGLLVAPKYGYFKLADGSAGFSVSAAPNSNNSWDDGYYMEAGASMRAGDMNGVNSRVNATGPRSMLKTYGDALVAMIGTASVGGSYADTGYVSAILQSIQGTAVIVSGSYIRPGSDDREPLIDTLLEKSKIIQDSSSEHNVAIYAEDGIEIGAVSTHRANGIRIWTNSYLTQVFSRLILEGNTFGALPSTDNGRSFIISQKSGGEGTSGDLDDIRWGETTGHSGFYAGSLSDSDRFRLVGTGNWDATNNAHILNSTRHDTNYHTVTVAFPEEQAVSPLPKSRPVVTSSVYSGIGNNNVKPRVRYSKELAYAEDIYEMTGMSYGKMGAFGYSDTSSEQYSVATLENPVVMPVYYGETYNTYQGIVSASERNVCDGLSIRYNDTEGVIKISQVRYQCIGRHVDVSMHMSVAADLRVAISNDTLIIFSLMLGCGVEPDISRPLSWLPIIKHTLLSGSIVPGNFTKSDTNATVPIRGALLGDGLLVVGFEYDADRDAISDYEIRLSGFTPFDVKQECCGKWKDTAGDETASSWSTTMTDSKLNGIHPTYSDLVGDGDYALKKLLNVPVISA